MPQAEPTGGHRAASARVVATTAARSSASRLASNWKKIILASLIGLILGQIYIRTATPMYASTATLFFDPSAGRINDAIEQHSALIENQVAIITSDGVLKKVVGTLNLVGDAEFASENSPLRKAIIAALIPGSTQGTAFERALSSLKEAVRVSRPKQSYFLEITATTRSPEKSAAVVASIIDAYFADQANTQLEDINRANEHTASRLGELREQVRQAELRADEYKKSNKVQSVEDGGIEEQQLARLSAELDSAKSAPAGSKAQRDQIQAALEAGSENFLQSDIGGTSLIATLREQYAQFSRREASLLATLKTAHPDIIDIRSQMVAVKAQISAEWRRLGAAADSAYDIASYRENELDKQLKKARQQREKHNTAQIRELELEREVSASRELLRSYLARSNEAHEEEVAAPQTRVISRAAPANASSHPMPLVVLAVSAVAGLASGVIWALRQHQVEPSISAAADLANLTGIASVSLIPRLKRPFGSALWRSAVRVGEPSAAPQRCVSAGHSAFAIKSQSARTRRASQYSHVCVSARPCRQFGSNPRRSL